MTERPDVHAVGAVRAVHTVGDLRESSGGPSRSVTALCDALDRVGASVSIVTSQPGPDEPILRPSRPDVDLRLSGKERKGLWRGANSPFGRAVTEAVAASGPAVVQNHGVWVPTNRAAALAARAADRPFVVSPKGMLSEWALSVKRVKKQLAWHLYQRHTLEMAQAFVVTAEAEAEDVRRLGLRQPIAVIPHGVAFSPPGTFSASTQGEEPRTALFLSRVHPKKGLPDLVEAWGRVRPEGWRLVIAGPDEGGHRAEIERQIQQLGLGDAVSFVGPVGDDEKWDLYGAADLFVLATHSENFGIVIAEALATGVPVVTTHGAPWEVLVSHRCGWWVETGAEPFAAALSEATSASPDVLRAMGARGRAYVEEHLSWDRSAAEHLALYHWLLGTGPRPDSVGTM